MAAIALIPLLIITTILISSCMTYISYQHAKQRQPPVQDTQRAHDMKRAKMIYISGLDVCDIERPQQIHLDVYSGTKAGRGPVYHVFPAVGSPVHPRLHTTNMSKPANRGDIAARPQYTRREESIKTLPNDTRRWSEATTITLSMVSGSLGNKDSSRVTSAVCDDFDDGDFENRCSKSEEVFARLSATTSERSIISNEIVEPIPGDDEKMSGTVS